MKCSHGRRAVLKQGAALGAAVALGPVGLGAVRAQADDLAPYRAAKINWKQSRARPSR
jgi:multiple sugar transport system substrate-binding protein